MAQRVEDAMLWRACHRVPAGGKNAAMNGRLIDTVPAMPFGRHKGEPLRRVPLDYLRWLADRPRLPWRVALSARGELARREAIAAAEAARLWPLPTAEARAVCGVELDELEAAIFERAAAAGVLTVTLDLPVASPVLTAWRRWCQAEGVPHRVEGRAACFEKASHE
jgi:hypothetical protein